MNRPPTSHDLYDIARRAMIQRGFLPDFSAEALAEVAAARPQADRQAGPSGDRGAAAIEDLTDRLWMSVDNESSRDLDQLSLAEPLGNGGIRVLVALADVDALVPEGSAVDRHARTNTTTVYTAAGIFSMIPERLSTDLTSLNQDQVRLAVVVQMDVDADGRVPACEVYRARVVNRARLTYDDVAAWLDGRRAAPAPVAAVPGMDAQIRLQDRAAQAMKRQRQSRGALSLDTIEAGVVFDGDVMTGLVREEKNRAKELIEDFMIAANSATASFLERRGYPSIRRVLRAPARWDRIVTLAQTSGERLPAEPDAPALEAFLLRRRAAEPSRFADLSLAVVKLLGAGEYAVELPGQESGGHFGLAVKDYTHSTAPNRRFADLVTHRLIKAAIDGRPGPYSTDTLTALARQCTEQGNNASKVERQVRKSAAALMLASRIGERFEGIVTGRSEKGTYVRLAGPPVEGRVVDGFAGFDVGDRVRVELIGTNVEQGYIDFSGRGEVHG